MARSGAFSTGKSELCEISLLQISTLSILGQEKSQVDFFFPTLNPEGEINNFGVWGKVEKGENLQKIK